MPDRLQDVLMAADFVDVYWSIVVQEQGDLPADEWNRLPPATADELEHVIRKLHPGWPLEERRMFYAFWMSVPEPTPVRPWVGEAAPIEYHLPIPGIHQVESSTSPLVKNEAKWRVANPKNLADDLFDVVVHAVPEARVSFGLWRSLTDEFSQTSRAVAKRWRTEWIPEANVVRRYETPAHRRALVNAIPRFAEAMHQSKIWFTVNERSNHGYERSSGRLTDEPQTVMWRLHRTRPCVAVNWLAEFAPIYAALRMYPPALRDTIHELWTDGLQDLGATLEPNYTQEYLTIKVAGYAAYLFEPYFRLDISEKNETGILVNCTGDNGAGYDVTYAVRRDDPQTSRCLCGYDYPQGAEFRGESPLRQRTKSWIRAQYNSTHSRGDGVSWDLLSSPFFYFADDPAVFASSDIARKEEVEEQARDAAREMWTTLVLNDWFRGNR